LPGPRCGRLLTRERETRRARHTVRWHEGRHHSQNKRPLMRQSPPF
jgi:hypothetical protein